MAESHYSIIMRTLHLVVVCCGKKAFKKGHLFAQLLTLCKITLVSKRFGINRLASIRVPWFNNNSTLKLHKFRWKGGRRSPKNPEIFKILEFGLPCKRVGVKNNLIFKHVFLKPWQNNKSRKVSQIPVFLRQAADLNSKKVRYFTLLILSGL